MMKERAWRHGQERARKREARLRQRRLRLKLGPHTSHPPFALHGPQPSSQQERTRT